MLRNVLVSFAYLITPLRAEGLGGKFALARYYLAFLLVHALRRRTSRFYKGEPLLTRNVVLRGKFGVFFLREGTADAWVLGQGYEPDVHRFLEEVLVPGSVFVDVGANIGRYTITAAQIVGPSGLVLAIESSTANFEALLKNIHLNRLPNVVAVNAACWSSDCMLAVVPSSAATGFWDRVRLAGDDEENSIVRGTTLDAILLEKDIRGVDVLKVDVEGATVEVLRGGLQTLGGAGPVQVVFEALEEAEEEESSKILTDLGFTVKPLWGKDYIALRPYLN